ncbi:MAG TPA: M50 family metallopeptidase [Candidatus Dormibacteraeota bacterium]|nr:M50 family metallopeptidase [Candidatus Dormibacteraeota bacterium]
MSGPDLAGAATTFVHLAAIVGIFLLLVIPHEGGHFLLAKRFRVPVYEFSVGMGPRIVSWARDGTTYALRLIPLGGFVRLAGLEPDDPHPDSFHARPAHQRLLILFAGPAVNFLVATLLMTGVSLAQVNADPGKVVGVERGGPAYAQGIRPGDSVRSVDGRPVVHANDILRAEQADGGRPIQFVVRRPDGSTFTRAITPRYDASVGRYLVGIETEAVVTPLQALGTGLAFPVVSTVAIGQGIYQVVTGQIPGGLLGPAGLSGPVGFGWIAYEAAAQGLLQYLGIAAILSMALGLTNLLPIPALDGARILVVVLEKLRGHPFDREREMAVQRLGLYALLALMAFITVLDVQRITSGQFGLR